jgi:hypothetical protein
MAFRYKYNQLQHLQHHSCHYPVSELLCQQGLKECEQHVENVGLVHNVETFEPKWNAILKNKKTGNKRITYNIILKNKNKLYPYKKLSMF